MESFYRHPHFDESLITPFSWPHGAITSIRTVLLFDVFLARFARTFCDAPLDPAEHWFLLLLVILLLGESAYAWLQIHWNGQIWTKMFLCYPLLAVVMFADGLCMINLLNACRHIAVFFPMGWPIFWTSLEMISAFGLLFLCGLHLCFDQTFAILVDEFRQLAARTIEAVQQSRGGGGGTGGEGQGLQQRSTTLVNRNGYEHI